MIKIAVYGKGGIGKSTTVSNLSVALAETGLRVMQIGCDPKADSTLSLRQGQPMETVLDLIRTKPGGPQLEEMVRIGYGGVACVEAGGPTPGMGCAGRGIIAALEKLAQQRAYEVYKPDVVFYDVLGDVVCGGFAMPMRSGYADRVFILTSGENMALHAAANIAMIQNFFFIFCLLQPFPSDKQSRRAEARCGPGAVAFSFRKRRKGRLILPACLIYARSRSLSSPPASFPVNFVMPL